MRYKGKITTWKDDQGFGFVTSCDGGEKAFVHIKSFLKRSRRPAEGDLITYELTIDDKNRSRANNVMFSNERATATSTSRKISTGTVFAALFCCFLMTATFMGRLPLAVLGVYLAASVIAYFAYAIDKDSAENNRWRTQESTLHLFGLIGGWPGALLAQKMLRHKSKKEEFQTVFWATVVLNCGALGWLFTKGGSDFLRSVVGS